MTDLDTLPKPRLQLRWRKPNAREMKKKTGLGCAPDWFCEYDLILPLEEHDIRRKKKRDYLAVSLGGTFCNTTASEMLDSPYRDGAHASWDSKALGGIPVVVIGSDGIARRKVMNAPGEGYQMVPFEAAPVTPDKRT